jgi:hypothetical protein
MDSDAQLTRRLQITCQLHDFGVAMMQQQLRSRYPSESEDQINERFRTWMLNLPQGARVPLRLARLAGGRA